jgi:L-rhamnose mutarotase
MLKALHKHGWHNYSLYLREDGLLIGYLETPNYKFAVDNLNKEEINKKWQEKMGEYFVEKEIIKKYSEKWLDIPRIYKKNPITEVFHLANGKSPKTCKRVCFLLKVKKECVDKYIFEYQ